jgi:itaconate CoA-transferase
VPYGPFRAGDGKTVFLSIQNEREFARFCDMVLENATLTKDARFASGPARLQNRDAMHAEIERVFGKLTAAQAVERLERAEIANARLNTMLEFWEHPQLEARGRWAEVDTPAGSIRAMKPPFNLSDFEPRMAAVPALGEHNRKILAELGYSEAEIYGLANSGAIG